MKSSKESESSRFHQDAGAETKSVLEENETQAYARSLVADSTDWCQFLIALATLNRDPQDLEQDSKVRPPQMMLIGGAGDARDQALGAKRLPTQLLLVSYVWDAMQQAPPAKRYVTEMTRSLFQKKDLRDFVEDPWLGFHAALGALQTEVKNLVEYTKKAGAIDVAVKPEILDKVKQFQAFLNLLGANAEKQRRLLEPEKVWYSPDLALSNTRLSNPRTPSNRLQTLLSIRNSSVVLKRKAGDTSLEQVFALTTQSTEALEDHEQQDVEKQPAIRLQATQLVKLLGAVSYTDSIWQDVTQALFLGPKELQGNLNPFQAKIATEVHALMAEIARSVFLPSLLSADFDLADELKKSPDTAALLENNSKFDQDFGQVLRKMPTEYMSQFIEALLQTIKEPDLLTVLAGQIATRGENREFKNPFDVIAHKLSAAGYLQKGGMPPDLFWQRMLSRNWKNFKLDLSTRFFASSSLDQKLQAKHQVFEENRAQLIEAIESFSLKNEERELANAAVQHIENQLQPEAISALQLRAAEMQAVAREMLKKVLAKPGKELAYFDEPGHKREVVFGGNELAREAGLHSVMYTQRADGNVDFALTTLDGNSSQLYGLLSVKSGEVQVVFNQQVGETSSAIRALLELCISAYFCDLSTRTRSLPELKVARPVRKGFTGAAGEAATDGDVQGDEKDAEAKLRRRADKSDAGILKKLHRITPDSRIDSEDLLRDVKRYKQGVTPHSVSSHVRRLVSETQFEAYKKLVDRYVGGDQSPELETALVEAVKQMSSASASKIASFPPMFLGEEHTSVVDPIDGKTYFPVTWVKKHFVPALSEGERASLETVYSQRYAAGAQSSFLDAVRELVLIEYFETK